MSADEDDSLLVALIDGRLGGDAIHTVETRLANDPDYRERLSQLQAGGRPFASAFESLLDEAPLARLKATLDARLEAESVENLVRAPSLLRRNRFGIAAAVVLFCVGLAAGRYAPSWLIPSSQIAAREERGEDWRQAVAEYMSLYTSDTFAGRTTSQPDELAALGAKIGLALTPERIALANLQFKNAQIFNYDGAPLGQLAYIDAGGDPVLFCIIRNSQADATMTMEKREGYAVASWARDGRGYMLIGNLPSDQVAGLADSLTRRF
jgi:anti-sigma factor RsiW